MLFANVAYVCFALKLDPQELYPDQSLLPNLQLIHRVCLRNAESLVSYMHTNFSDSPSDSSSDIGNADAMELVSSLVHRYKNLATKSSRVFHLPHQQRSSLRETNNRGDSDWLIVENDHTI